MNFHAQEKIHTVAASDFPSLSHGWSAGMGWHEIALGRRGMSGVLCGVAVTI